MPANMGATGGSGYWSWYAHSMSRCLVGSIRSTSTYRHTWQNRRATRADALGWDPRIRHKPDGWKTPRKYSAPPSYNPMMFARWRGWRPIVDGSDVGTCGTQFCCVGT